MEDNSQVNALRLNLGCGARKKENYINVDMHEGNGPDLLIDLTKSEWPWKDSSVSEVCFEFSLEQMGQSLIDLQFVIRSLYRVCQDKAAVKILAYHPRSDKFLLNPLCVHKISPDFFSLLSVQQNLAAIPLGLPYDPVALQWGVNFEMSDVKYLLDPQFEEGLKSGDITEEVLRDRIKYENNICHAFEVSLRTVKV